MAEFNPKLPELSAAKFWSNAAAVAAAAAAEKSRSKPQVAPKECNKNVADCDGLKCTTCSVLGQPCIRTCSGRRSSSDGSQCNETGFDCLQDDVPVGSGRSGPASTYCGGKSPERIDALCCSGKSPAEYTTSAEDDTGKKCINKSGTVDSQCRKTIGASTPPEELCSIASAIEHQTGPDCGTRVPAGTAETIKPMVLLNSSSKIEVSTATGRDYHGKQQTNTPGIKESGVKCTSQSLAAIEESLPEYSEFETKPDNDAIIEGSNNCPRDSTKCEPGNNCCGKSELSDGKTKPEPANISKHALDAGTDPESCGSNQESLSDNTILQHCSSQSKNSTNHDVFTTSDETYDRRRTRYFGISALAPEPEPNNTLKRLTKAGYSIIQKYDKSLGIREGSKLRYCIQPSDDDREGDRLESSGKCGVKTAEYTAPGGEIAGGKAVGEEAGGEKAGDEQADKQATGEKTVLSNSSIDQKVNQDSTVQKDSNELAIGYTKTERCSIDDTESCAKNADREPSIKPELEIVVAHYKEDLSWLQTFVNHPNVKVTIYSKGGKPLTPELEAYTTHIENIGREGHTYLQHIVKNYGQLSSTMLFVQGNPMKHFHVDYKVEEFLEDALKVDSGEFVTFRGNKIKLFDRWDGFSLKKYSLDILPEQSKMEPPKPLRTPGEYWKKFMGPLGYEVPKSLVFVCGANFAVRKEMVEKFGKEFWEQILGEFFLGKMKHENPLTGHICECFWGSIFRPDEFTLRAGDTLQVHPRYGRYTKGNWKITPQNSPLYVRDQSRHGQGLAVAIGIDKIKCEEQEQKDPKSLQADSSDVSGRAPHKYGKEFGDAYRYGPKFDGELTARNIYS